MSYTKEVTKVIEVPYEVSIDCPPSKSWHTAKASGTVHETVVVRVNVDTEPYDASIESCNHHVLGLTGAVAATEIAHVTSIADRAKQISATVVSGFFKTVRSEITQQIAELMSEIEALLVHLQSLKKRCIEKQTQMQSDFNRIASRYVKIFTDLNAELENRIKEIDKPVFDFQRIAASVSDKTFDAAGAAMVQTAEMSGARTKVEAGRIKSDASSTLDCVGSFLEKSNDVKDVLSRSSINAKEEMKTAVPVIFMESKTDKGVERNVWVPEPMKDTQNNPKVESMLSAEKYPTLDADQKEMLHRYFLEDVAKDIPANDEHNRRVSDLMKKLFSLDQTNK